MSSETFHNYVSATMVHVNHALKLITRLFLVEDLVDSLKVGPGAGLGLVALQVGPRLPAPCRPERGASWQRRVGWPGVASGLPAWR